MDNNELQNLLNKMDVNKIQNSEATREKILKDKFITRYEKKGFSIKKSLGTRGRRIYKSRSAADDDCPAGGLGNRQLQGNTVEAYEAGAAGSY